MRNQKGFAAIESILIVIIVALLAGVGYYVWHTNQQTKATLDAASKSAQSSPSKIVMKTTTNSSSKPTAYIIVKEWAVRAPITDGMTYIEHSETVQGELFVGFTSSKLSAYADCNQAGGIIGRYTADQPADDAGDTAASLAKSAPDKVKQVGNYYFVFTHDQAACSDNTSAQALQSQNNNDLLAMMQHFQAY